MVIPQAATEKFHCPPLLSAGKWPCMWFFISKMSFLPHLSSTLTLIKYSQTLKRQAGGRILQFVTMLPKARPLCTLVPNQTPETILGEVDKDSFIVLPGKAFQGSLDIK